MNETLTHPAPALSPSFDRARMLSRIMALLFTIAFWLIAAVLACLPLMLVWPMDAGLTINGELVRYADLTRGQQFLAFLAAALNLAAALPLMHHLRRAFGAFARGEVFSSATIVHIRSTGIWLIACFLAGVATVPLMIGAGLHDAEQMPVDFWPLFTGLTTFIAAHVMTEASRIAADHAEIV